MFTSSVQAVYIYLEQFFSISLVNVVTIFVIYVQFLGGTLPFADMIIFMNCLDFKYVGILSKCSCRQINEFSPICCNNKCRGVNSYSISNALVGFDCLTAVIVLAASLFSFLSLSVFVLVSAACPQIMAP